MRLYGQAAAKLSSFPHVIRASERLGLQRASTSEKSPLPNLGTLVQQCLGSNHLGMISTFPSRVPGDFGKLESCSLIQFTHNCCGGNWELAIIGGDYLRGVAIVAKYR